MGKVLVRGHLVFGLFGGELERVGIVSFWDAFSGAIMYIKCIRPDDTLAIVTCDMKN